jgi:hypothetical protein
VDDSEVEGLYALAPEQFVAARDQLARRLRSEGRRQEAAQVRALARPTVPAWALNQLARSLPAEIEDLVAVGAELRSAQDRALSGRGGAQLRQAGERRREAVKALTERAGALLSDAGRDPAAHLAAIASALEAAAVDEEAAAALCAGRLSKPPERQSGFAESGFPDPTELAPAPAAPPATPRSWSLGSRASRRRRPLPRSPAWRTCSSGRGPRPVRRPSGRPRPRSPQPRPANRRRALPTHSLRPAQTWSA